MNLKFYECEVCGKIITTLYDIGIPTECCGQDMTELVPNTKDGASEKHVPVFSREGNTVRVRIGSEPHPMTDTHRITWVALSTGQGFQVRELHPGDIPEVTFLLDPEDPVDAVYAYCDIHGLWVSRQEKEV